MLSNITYTRKFGLDAFYLKIIAIVTMIVDHIGLVLMNNNIILRTIGRIAFPIFCFLIVEGFYHTSNIKKYLSRMLAFAIISEIPFNLMVSGKIFDANEQNVFFTLFLGLLMLYIMQKLLVKYMNPMLSTICLIGGIAVAYFLKTDYSYYGIIIIYFFYSCRNRRTLGCVIMGIASIMMGFIQGAAVLSIPFILLYNGKKGPKVTENQLLKYGFYVFYPVHMLLLVLIRNGI